MWTLSVICSQYIHPDCSRSRHKLLSLEVRCRLHSYCFRTIEECYIKNVFVVHTLTMRMICIYCNKIMDITNFTQFIRESDNDKNINLPNGIEFDLAEIGSGSTKTTASIALDLKDTYFHFTALRQSGKGVVPLR